MAQHYVRQYWSQLVSVALLLGFLAGLSYLAIHFDNKLRGEDKSETALNFPDDTSVGTWEWRPLRGFSQGELEELISFAASEQIKTIYFSVDEYVDLYEKPDDDPGKMSDLQHFETNLRTLTRLARNQGLSIQALAGHSDWSKPDYQYVPQLLLEYVAGYNSRVGDSEKLSGLQFDIEPQNQAGFDQRQEPALSEYLGLVEQITTRKQLLPSMQGVALGWTVPYWFDNENGNTPEVDRLGMRQPPVYHLFDILNSSADNYIVVMAYRDKADGRDGSIAHSQAEIDYATDRTPNVKVVIGQETAQVEPAKITFHDQSENDLKRAVQAITDSFKSKPVYGGVAIHTLSDYKYLQ